MLSTAQSSQLGLVVGGVWCVSTSGDCKGISMHVGTHCWSTPTFGPAVLIVQGVPVLWLICPSPVPGGPWCCQRSMQEQRSLREKEEGREGLQPECEHDDQCL
ncbi:Hypothetical predicted protein [Marmota monax]|uniref:Uncharacterized protein n=1 Tax=Marmota monax TaxID=9995 RepID=A0A5E4C6K7_MARMO|nr:hypothetical protein GHT09_007899 [Marmota monax]VTJ76769.1 Hypothetical predicted protein [Marmota monax]